ISPGYGDPDVLLTNS
ncbi:unnamed protein product, partial [Allacma fusca]